MDADLYFVRANGDTSHNEPGTPAFVPGEPPTSPDAYFNYAGYSLTHGFARIGWPDTGDLRSVPAKERARALGYTFASLPQHVRKYLDAFRDIPVGGVVLIPDPDAAAPGTLYVGTVTRPYHYVPDHPYECAHRVGVAWDRDPAGWATYSADELGIGIRGGWWLWAFHRLGGARWSDLRAAVAASRERRAVTTPAR